MVAMPDFAQADLPVNFSIFAVAAAVVRAAGARIIRYANAISSKIGIGHSTIGVLLLGGITSLSEVGVVVTSAATGTGHMATYVSSIYILSRAKGSKAWIAAEQGGADHRLDRQLADAQEKVNREFFADRSLPRLVIGTAALALVILVAGYLLSRTGDALAQQTGLGGSFVGFVLLAFATSLPELSVSIAAVRIGLYTLAIADILGSNLINGGLILVIDLVGVGDPILNQVGAFSIFGALLGIVLTAFFVIGMAERGHKTMLRMGYDSAAVLLCYSAGLVVLFSLR